MRRIEPGDVVVTTCGARITLTTTPGTILDGLTDNRAVTIMGFDSLGIVLARVKCELGDELLVLSKDGFGWNMAEHFRSCVDV